MALLVDKLFITKDAFQSYRDISEHMDEERINAAIREAQVSDLVAFIGPEIYLALQNDYDDVGDTFPTARWDELFNGVDYDAHGKTIRQHGLQPMLTMYAYARMLTQLQLTVTRLGPMTMTEADVSDPTTQAQIKTKVIDARAMAVSYGAEVTEFLKHKRIVYPEFKYSEAQKTGFKFFKVP